MGVDVDVDVDARRILRPTGRRAELEVEVDAIRAVRRAARDSWGKNDMMCSSMGMKIERLEKQKSKKVEPFASEMTIGFRFRVSPTTTGFPNKLWHAALQTMAQALIYHDVCMHVSSVRSHLTDILGRLDTRVIFDFYHTRSKIFQFVGS